MKSKLSLLALLLTLSMLLGALAACGDNTSDESSDQSSATQATEAEKNESEESGSTGETESTFESESQSASESESEYESESQRETETETTPSIADMDNGILIENAYSLANGVNAYFTSGKRTDFALVNQKMTLEYALANYKDQKITYIKNADGKTYIENTADVFVKMKNGNTFYASNSNKNATANLYRFGYYMYEARFEEQLFSGDINVENEVSLNLDKVTRNETKLTKNEDDSLHVNVNGSDPYITFKGINFKAEDYNFVQLTMKANATKGSSIALYIIAGSKSGFSESQAKYISFFNDGEYHTYTFPLYELADYTGNVSALRLDFSGEKGSTFDISNVKIVKGDDGGVPKTLELNRSFFVYSDKMHHYLQVATREVEANDIASIGMETRIPADTVAGIMIKDKNGTHTSLDGVDWQSAECVGFDIKDAGIFGYILPADKTSGSFSVTLEDGVYVVIQSRAPENGTIIPSGKYSAEKERIIANVPLNGNDFFMGQRIYTDDSHSFDTFLHETEIERNPLSANNFTVDGENSTNASYVGYDALRGIYTFNLDSTGFNAPYYRHPNKHYNVKFTVKGDSKNRNIYIMAASTSGCLECAALLDENNMMLPIPIEVGKNFSEGTGERNLWNIDDKPYGEAIIPMVILADSEDTYNFLNLYQNWGRYPLKQVSWIQFYAPYYHLSTGVTETNCIVPYYACKNARGLNTLPDHRSMSAPEWSDQPQHNSCGVHKWLIYTDADGIYSASENTLNTIDSFGPTYADVKSYYISDDGNIKVTYTHTEFPQTDENRTYYEMKYEVIGDVSFNDFSRDFQFYHVTDNDPTGIYQSVGYLDKNNKEVIVNAAKEGESNKYVLGDECPYFSFFNMKNSTSTSQQGYSNVSFLVYNSEFVIGGEKVAPSFSIINENNGVRISLDLEKVTLKAGDSFTINAIVLPWGSQVSVYDSDKFAGDQNVRDVRTHTLLDPLTPKALENCEVIESVFVPKLKTTNGKSAEFTLTGGENNVAVRVYGFDKLTVPYIEELVDGEWVEYKINSAFTPDIQGNAHYYDGYCVYYDMDGTFSYSFVTDMNRDDKDGRTFRISAEKDFEKWPDELPDNGFVEEDLPLNVYVDAKKLQNEAMLTSGPQFNGVTLSSDSSYVSFEAKGLTESYFTAYPGGTVATGQYAVIKYRLPSSNVGKITTFEIFASTVNSSAGSSDCFSLSNLLKNDGKWHVMIVDLASWGKTGFVPAEDGTYKANFVRLDLFYKNPVGVFFELAFVGMSDNTDDIYALVNDMDAVQFVSRKDNVTEVVNIDPKNGEVVELPEDEEKTEETQKPVEETTEKAEGPVIEDATSSVEGFNFYLEPSAIISKINEGGNGHGGEEEVLENSYARVHYCTDKSRSENYRLESYFYLLKEGTLATGQYFVVKYRAPEQIGGMQVYSSTKNASASDGGNSIMLQDSADGKNGLFIGDNEWHLIVIDLSKVLATYSADSNGKYAAKHLRLDLFNLSKPLEDGKTTYVDIAYVGLCDDYTEILGKDTSVSDILFFDKSSSTATAIPNKK